MENKTPDYLATPDSEFLFNATQHVIGYLSEHPQASSEDITDSCKKAGILPKDDRAFGAVYAYLSRRKTIRVVGWCFRRKGHGTAGGRLWEINPEARKTRSIPTNAFPS